MSALREFRREIGHQARAAVRRARSLVTPGSVLAARFRDHYFADRAVDLDRIRDYRYESFPRSGPMPWLDRTDAEPAIAERLAKGEISSEEAEQCRAWARNGYVALSGLFEAGYLESVWAAYERGVAAGKVPLQPEPPAAGDPWPQRSLDPHLALPEVDGLLRHPGLLRWSRLLLGREIVPFQTLVSHKGSQQRPHSDSIHMTTYPEGYLTAAWIAFEEIHPDCGPVAYYPGSHRLPFLSSQSLGISPADFRRHGYELYFARYEPAIGRLIAERTLEAVPFLARKGDVLLWHANLIHAGTPRKDLALSRKSAVCHYFARGAVCYHDLSATLTPASRLEPGSS